jgi:site-specific DNA-methyltransferase (adenine-specific)/modification methylase
MIELNKIYCESNLDTMAKMPDNFVDLIVTSPPYNINLRVRKNKYCKRSKNEIGPCNKYENFTDDLNIDEYYNIHEKIIDEMLRVSKQTFYIIQLVTGNKEAVFKLLGRFCKEIKEFIIWDKKISEPAIMHNVLNSEFEIIIVFDKETSRQRLFKNANFDKGKLSNIFRIHKSDVGTEKHKATFPLKLPKTIINYFSNEDDIIYDPFMGLGTTAIAAINLKRNWIGSEINKEYVKIAEQRIKPYLNQTSLF